MASVHIETQARQSLLAKKMNEGGYTIPARRTPMMVNNHQIEDVKRQLIMALNAGSSELVIRSLSAYRKQKGSLPECFREIERIARDRIATKHH